MTNVAIFTQDIIEQDQYYYFKKYLIKWSA